MAHPLAIAHRGIGRTGLRPCFVGVGRQRLHKPQTAPSQPGATADYAATWRCFHLRFPCFVAKWARPMATTPKPGIPWRASGRKSVTHGRFLALRPGAMKLTLWSRGEAPAGKGHRNAAGQKKPPGDANLRESRPSLPKRNSAGRYAAHQPFVGPRNTPLLREALVK